MAKKSRTPPPPRKVQAPKTRSSPRTPDERRRYYIFIGFAAAGLVGLAIALALVLSSSGGSGGNLTSLATTMRTAGCTFTTATSSGNRNHLAKLSDKVSYNTFPPTSGPHFGEPARWGNYSQIVDPRQAVHNEEHGGVIVWYGDKISAANRQKINELYDDSPEGILVTPLASATPGITYPPHKPLGSRTALTAWNAPSGAGQGVVAICPNVDLQVFQKFRDRLRGKGPERFSLSAMQPGT